MILKNVGLSPAHRREVGAMGLAVGLCGKQV